MVDKIAQTQAPIAESQVPSPESRPSDSESRIPSPEIAIKVENLTKIYKLYDSPQDRLKEALNPFRRKYHKDFHALTDVSMEIRKGETVGILGQNGAGKSTLLKLITGVINPSSGSVQVHGRISALLELGAGFNPEISGLENVYFNGTIQGFSREQMDAKMDDILSFADIGDFIHQRVKIYSSGMFLRLAFAVAVNIDPEILIIDEALSVGDVMFQGKCMDRIKTMMNDGVTTLFVTHSMDTVNTLCDYAYMLDGGQVFTQGKPQAVTLQYYQLIREREHAAQALQQAESEQEKAAIAEQLNQIRNQIKEKTEQEDYRYGTGGARITNYVVLNSDNIETTILKCGESFVFSIRVEFLSRVESPCVGFGISNVAGQSLLAAHTYMDGPYDFGPKDSGDILEVEIQKTMLLNPGKYLLSFGVAEHRTVGDFTNLDSRKNVCSIEVYGKTNAVGLIFHESVVRELVQQEGKSPHPPSIELDGKEVLTAELAATKKTKVLLVCDIREWALGTVARYFAKYNSRFNNFKIVAMNDADFDTILDQEGNSFDLVHWLSPWDFLANGHRISLPTVVSINHIVDASQFVDQCRVADAIHVLASECEQQVRALGFRDVYKITIGVDESLFLPCKRNVLRLENGKEGKIILPLIGKETSNQNDRKGTEFLFQIATELVKKYQVELIVTGYGWDDFICKLETINISTRRLLFLTPEEMENIYSEFDFFLITSRVEGGPLPLLEAMASGIPVISTPVGIVNEVITNGVNGYIIPYGDVDTALANINLLMEDREKLADMGIKARETIERNWTWERVATDKLSPLYEKAIENYNDKKNTLAGIGQSQDKLYKPSIARVESNKWLRCMCNDITGTVLSIGSGNDDDGEGDFYRNYFKSATSYTTAEYSQNFKTNLILDVRCMKEIADESYDCVFCSGVLEHVDDYQAGLKEIARVLKTGGILLLGLPFRQAIHESPYDYWRFTTYGIEYLLKDAFHLMDIVSIDNVQPMEFPAAYWTKAVKKLA